VVLSSVLIFHPLFFKIENSKILFSISQYAFQVAFEMCFPGSFLKYAFLKKNFFSETSFPGTCDGAAEPLDYEALCVEHKTEQHGPQHDLQELFHHHSEMHCENVAVSMGENLMLVELFHHHRLW
jgi:hypothetical protein